MLKTTGMLAAALSVSGLGGTAAWGALRARAVGRARALRFAHLTDIHIQPERQAAAGLAACVHHVQADPDKVELVITGGDLVMDSFDAGFDRTKQQWDLYTGVLRSECGVPVRHCLGNHDIWGWNKKKSQTTGEEPRWGKAWATQLLELPKPYYSFDQAGWHFIVLDSVFPDGDGYIGRLDEAQVAWLESDLTANAGKPTVVVSHIPIVTVCAMMHDGKSAKGAHSLGHGSMHADAGALHGLFVKHGGVKLCLSGHIHLNDRAEYEGVTYICDGAVSGAWWKGKEDRCDEGYGVVDLFEDGAFEHRYVKYGWKAAK